jgi:hypothetical protein
MPATSINSTPGTILGHIRSIRKAHERLVGRSLSWEDAIARLDRFNAMQTDDMPLKNRDVAVGCFLVGETYSRESINKILAHVAIFGFARGCVEIDDCDAEAVDELLAAEAHVFVGL